MTTALAEVPPKIPRSGGIPGSLLGGHPILRFVLGRLLTGVLTLLIASLLIFLATNALPGGVADAVLGRNATPERLQSLNRQLGLDQPLLSRYFSWLGGIFRGDLGQSAVQLAQGSSTAPLTHIISGPLGNSLIIGSLAAVCLLPAALLLGVISGVKFGGRLDFTVSYSSLVFGALPEFVLGTFLILLFFSKLKWFPPVALVPSGESPLAHPDSLVLPVATLFLVSLAFASRQVRAGMIDVMTQDYVTSARLSGLSEKTVLLRYGVRNALAPSVQTFAQTLQYLFGGIIVVEALFAYPGIGQLLVNAVAARDLPEVQAIAFVLAALYILINIMADLLVILLVPKLRTARQ